MTATDPTEQAIRTVARRVLARTIEMAIKSDAILWEDYPELGQDDWQDVLAYVERLAERGDVQHEHYESAYRHLAARANETEPTP